MATLNLSPITVLVSHSPAPPAASPPAGYPYEDLPAELKHGICEHLTCNEDERCVVEYPGVSRFAVVEYDSKRILWHPRGVSHEFCTIYETAMRTGIGDKPFTMTVGISGAASTSTFGIDGTFYDHCTPDVRTLGSRPTVWAMKTWCGLLIAAAYDTLSARRAHPVSIFSYNTQAASQAVETVEERACMGMMAEFEVHRHASRAEPREIQGFVLDAFTHLSVCPKIEVTFLVPKFLEADCAQILSLVHDLRYFTDNNLLDIKLVLACPDSFWGYTSHWKKWAKGLPGNMTVEVIGRKVTGR